MTSPADSIRDQTNARIYAASDLAAEPQPARVAPEPIEMINPIADVTKGV